MSKTPQRLEEEILKPGMAKIRIMPATEINVEIFLEAARGFLQEHRRQKDGEDGHCRLNNTRYSGSCIQSPYA